MDTLNKGILIALLDAAQHDERASIQYLSDRLGRTRTEVAQAVSELDRRGLVRAETVRLSFLGLTEALGLRARARQSAARNRKAAA
ncbi:MAG: hypothetical protein B6A08_18320 [Sorangiineae bacterium NIC37A_2]|jgi:DNA-binding Lrp family transcriptional regulator|nr:MAG: hypothetical protein B6A08_18320 [Sorangiineae bacterium NIC37A_2]